MKTSPPNGDRQQRSSEHAPDWFGWTRCPMFQLNKLTVKAGQVMIKFTDKLGETPNVQIVTWGEQDPGKEMPMFDAWTKLWTATPSPARRRRPLVPGDRQAGMQGTLMGQVSEDDGAVGDVDRARCRPMSKVLITGSADGLVATQLVAGPRSCSPTLVMSGAQRKHWRASWWRQALLGAPCSRS